MTLTVKYIDLLDRVDPGSEGDPDGPRDGGAPPASRDGYARERNDGPAGTRSRMRRGVAGYSQVWNYRRDRAVC
jgi:hypothetical protein